MACTGQEPKGENTPDATPSPQASAIPAPLAIVPTALASLAQVATSESGSTPSGFRGDVPLGADVSARDPVVYTLSAVLKYGDVSGPPRAPEVNAVALEGARKKTELRLAIDVSASRMRTVVLGSGWLLPPESELRARSDRYGHVLVWPGVATYRPLAPGTLRALLGEGRFDVAPITFADLSPKDEAGKRIGIRTRKVDVVTRAAKATFEIGRLSDLDGGGILLCRMLLDLINAPPSTPLCADAELPVRAEFRWTGRGQLGFELTGVLKREKSDKLDKSDSAPNSLSVPPADATFAPSSVAAALVVNGLHTALTALELASFRTGPGDVQTVPRAPSDGLIVVNATDQVRLMHIDGVTVAWSAPRAKTTMHGLPKGRYTAQSRTFLGEAPDSPTTSPVPGQVQLGVPDTRVR